MKSSAPLREEGWRDGGMEGWRDGGMEDGGWREEQTVQFEVQ